MLSSPQFGAGAGRDRQTVPATPAEPLADALLADLPEFVPDYRALVQGCDDEPGEPVVLIALADFVADRLAALEAERSVLERALGLVEVLIASAADPETTTDLVGLAFFDSFTPEDRRSLTRWLGPCSRQALEALDVPCSE